MATIGECLHDLNVLGFREGEWFEEEFLTYETIHCSSGVLECDPGFESDEETELARFRYVEFIFKGDDEDEMQLVLVDKTGTDENDDDWFWGDEPEDFIQKMYGRAVPYEIIIDEMM